MKAHALIYTAVQIENQRYIGQILANHSGTIFSVIL